MTEDQSPAASNDPRLSPGQRLSREEFHRLYEESPEDFRAELIGGVVYLPPRTTCTHGSILAVMGGLLQTYVTITPGIEAGIGTTILLGPDSEPQPDLYLRVLPERGGRSTTDNDDYIVGPPEFVCEIAEGTETLDLAAKRADYAKYGVLEYIVLLPRQKMARWFDLANNQERPLPKDGVICSREFPGLWLSTSAILQRNYGAVMADALPGSRVPEHETFMERLYAHWISTSSGE